MVTTNSKLALCAVALALQLISVEPFIEPRIVGGVAASPGEYPFYAYWGCGSSLIHPQILLTAAHCDVLSSRAVEVGAYDRRNPWNGTVSRTIAERRPHPDYDPSMVHNDFMLLKLNEPVHSIKPVILNEDEFFPNDRVLSFQTGELLTVIGFGRIAESGPSSTILMEVDVNYVPYDDCSRQFGSRIRRDIMLCAGSRTGGRDACRGDSGGPLFDRRENNTYVQVGVVSFGRGCGNPNFSGVYARVSGVIPWIREQICDLADMDFPEYCQVPTASPTASPTTPEPTPSPPRNTPSNPLPIIPSSCEDLTESTFKDNGLTNGEGNCTVLQDMQINNAAEYSRLCGFLDVALICPQTCEICASLPDLKYFVG